MNRLIKKNILIILLICLGYAVHILQNTLDRDREIHFIDKSPVFLPKGEVLKWMSMGYRGIVGDALWIKSVLYYGRRVKDHDNPYFNYALKRGDVDHAVNIQANPDDTGSMGNKLSHLLFQSSSKGLVDYIYPLIDRVTTVDPHFIFPYIFGGIYLLMDTGEINEAISLLQKGYTANLESWELPFYLGWVEWMYRNDLTKTTRYLMEAVGKNGCPDYVGEILTGLSRQLNQTQMTRLYLESLLKSTDNPEVEKRIRQLIQNISLQN